MISSFQRVTEKGRHRLIHSVEEETRGDVNGLRSQHKFLAEEVPGHLGLRVSKFLELNQDYWPWWSLRGANLTSPHGTQSRPPDSSCCSLEGARTWLVKLSSRAPPAAKLVGKKQPTPCPPFLSLPHPFWKSSLLLIYTERS